MLRCIVMGTRRLRPKGVQARRKTRRRSRAPRRRSCRHPPLLRQGGAANTTSVPGLHQAVTDWLQTEIEKGVPSDRLAVELMYVLGLGDEYLRRLPLVGPDAVTRIKGEQPVLHYIYNTYTEASPAAVSAQHYIAATRQQVLPVLLAPLSAYSQQTPHHTMYHTVPLTYQFLSSAINKAMMSSTRRKSKTIV